MAGLQRCHALTCVRVRSVQRVEDVRERRAIVFKAGVLTIVKARQEDASRRDARMKYLMQDSKKIDQLAPVAWQVEMAGHGAGIARVMAHIRLGQRAGHWAALVAALQAVLVAAAGKHPAEGVHNLFKTQVWRAKAKARKEAAALSILISVQKKENISDLSSFCVSRWSNVALVALVALVAV